MTADNLKFPIYFVTTWEQVLNTIEQCSGVAVPEDWIYCLATENCVPYKISDDSGYNATIEFAVIERNELDSLGGIVLMRVSWCASLADPASLDKGTMAFAFADRAEEFHLYGPGIVKGLGQ